MSEQKKARKPHQKNEAVIARMLRKRTEAFEKELRTALASGLDVTIQFSADLYDSIAGLEGCNGPNETKVSVTRLVTASVTEL